MIEVTIHFSTSAGDGLHGCLVDITPTIDQNYTTTIWKKVINAAIDEFICNHKDAAINSLTLRTTAPNVVGVSLE